MAQMLQGESTEPEETSEPAQDAPPDEEPEETTEVDERLAAWRERLAKTGGSDPALKALVTDLLRTGERRLLAKAVLLFPDDLPKAFPTEGSLASAKLELADYLKRVDPASLPTDAEFLERLERYAIASSLTAHPDTDLMRGLRDELGAAALADVLGRVPARYGALLFALAPEAMQHEAAGLVSQDRLYEAAAQLMLSNRMDPAETDRLLEVLSALRANAALPELPEQPAVSDRGPEFAAAAALSFLLPRLAPEARAYLVEATSSRLNGSLPVWLEGTMYGEMLLELPAETRTDLLLEVDPRQLSAWLQVQTSESKAALLNEAPAALRAAVSGSPPPKSLDDLHLLANEARSALSKAVQRLVLADRVAFADLLV